MLVIGAGPAALSIAAALGEQALAVLCLAPGDPAAAWPNPYGIWGPEVDGLGLGHLLAHRWSNCVSWFGSEPTQHGHDYGLFDKGALQAHGLEACRAAGVRWHQGLAATIAHDDDGSTVTTAAGSSLRARLVVDASGHEPVFLERPDDGPVAGQAAYGIVGQFSAAPVERDQFVLMDYRSDHLSKRERHSEPPTFLYAMDLGAGRFFVEETSLALAPPLPYATLRQRLERRLMLLLHRWLLIGHRMSGAWRLHRLLACAQTKSRWGCGGRGETGGCVAQQRATATRRSIERPLKNVVCVASSPRS